MALFPKIDQPCPLGIDEQKRIDGHCGRCSKTVHALDGMNDAERGAFLRNAVGPVCVSYRVPLRRGVSAGLGAALVLSLAGPVHATGVPQVSGLEGNGVHAVQAAQVTPVPPAPPLADADRKPEALMMGGVSNPADAAFVDDSDVPDLPLVRDTSTPDR